MAERQRGNVLDRTGRQYSSYRIGEFQRYRHAVAKNAGVVIEFGQGKYVLHHDVDVGLTFTDLLYQGPSAPLNTTPSPESRNICAVQQAFFVNVRSGPFLWVGGHGVECVG